MNEDLKYLMTYINKKGYEVSFDDILVEFRCSYLKDYLESGLEDKDTWVVVRNNGDGVNIFIEEFNLRLISLSEMSNILKARDIDAFRLLGKLYQTLGYESRTYIFEDVEFKDVIEDSLAYINIKFKDMLEEEIETSYNLIKKLYILKLYRNLLKEDIISHNMGSIKEVYKLIKESVVGVKDLNFSTIPYYSVLGVRTYNDMDEYIQINKERMYCLIKEKTDSKVHSLGEYNENKLTSVINSMLG